MLSEWLHWLQVNAIVPFFLQDIVEETSSTTLELYKYLILTLLWVLR